MVKKRALYIGIYTDGTTSRMRADTLKQLLPGWDYQVIDTDVPFRKRNRVFRSIGFRYKLGPVVADVNNYVRSNMRQQEYDLVWVDKAIYLTFETTKRIRQLARKLVHYTPDMAFFENRSQHFFKSLTLYDFAVTTKRKELADYFSLIPENKVILTTQGFDKSIHQPMHEFRSKVNRVAFVGLCEPAREQVLQLLIDNQVEVALAGQNWSTFVQKNKDNPYLKYFGDALWNRAYAELISSSYFSLGLLSKRFPELHTTRTFEIPACGTALITEKNEDTGSFYSDDEVIFFNDITELPAKLKYYQSNLGQLERITRNGYNRVHQGGYDYVSIMNRLLGQIAND